MHNPADAFRLLGFSISIARYGYSRRRRFDSLF